MFFFNWPFLISETFCLLFQQEKDPLAGFNIEALGVCTLDLIEAGTETAATTLRWGLVFLLNYPEVQGQSVINHKYSRTTS